MPKAEPPSKAVAARKRHRKRKRRIASSSSSSGSSNSTDEEVPPMATGSIATKAMTASQPSSSSSSSSESDSDMDDLLKTSHPSPLPMRGEATGFQADSRSKQHQRRSSSVSPPPASIPSFLPSKTSATEADQQNEQLLANRFRQFWMASVADGFKDDLEQIRKEPGLTTSRLAMLIDSLASGADVFTSSAPTGQNDVNEMEVILDS